MAEKQKPAESGKEQSNTIGEAMNVDFWTLLSESRIV